ncbi:MAG: winged helix-turn-helix domain-containing protein [Limisphaerales bacterium]
MTESLSIHEARKLNLLSQRLPSAKKSVGGAAAATLAAIEHLGYVQIDTISVIQRAHHHTLWNRHPRYRPSQLEQLLADRQVFEYWSHAAAYLPMRDYRFSLFRKRALARGEQEHWYDRNPRLEKQVLKRIREEGPLMARDFIGKRTGGEWKAKPAKRALENLFMDGELMSSRRINFQKVYDLTERVLPAGTDSTEPTPEEYARFLITRYLQANGLGRPAEFAYLLPGLKPLICRVVQDMTANGELISLRAAGEDFHVLPASLQLLNQALARRRVKILSPFDNFVIQRKRLQNLFDFDYQIECYLPAAKRRYGYFTLPILWDGRLAARMDCKAERKESLLQINHLALEPWLKSIDAFLEALRKELKSFMLFNQCDRIRLGRCSPAHVKASLRSMVQDTG